MSIRDKLIKIRSDSGLSQQDFAEKLNISRQTVTRWEAGKSVPSSAQILNICNEFGLDANELLSDGVTQRSVVKKQGRSFNKALAALIAVGVLIAAATAGLIATVAYCIKDAAYDTSSTVWIIAVPQNTPMIVLSVFLALFTAALAVLFIYLWRRGKK